MKLIKQSFEILEQTDFSLIGIKKFIERCGRVCYKSEDRITDTSYEKFVNMLKVFAELKLLTYIENENSVDIYLLECVEKVNLNDSEILARLNKGGN